jgi:hypothetical protein
MTSLIGYAPVQDGLTHFVWILPGNREVGCHPVDLPPVGL